MEYLAAGQWAKASEINEAVGVSDRRLRELLQDLVSEKLIVAEGENRWRIDGENIREENDTSSLALLYSCRKANNRRYING